MTEIKKINEKLLNYGVASYALKFNVATNINLGDIEKYSESPSLLYRCEYATIDKSTNVIVDFRFSPIESSEKDLVDILSIKLIPNRGIEKFANNPGEFELFQDTNIERDINNLSNTYDIFLKDPETRKLISKDERGEIAEGLRILRSNSKALGQLDPIRKVEINPDSDKFLDSRSLSKISSNQYILRSIIYLLLEHRVKTTGKLSRLEKPLKDFSWEKFKANNPNLKKNIALNYLKMIQMRDLIDVVFEVSFSRGRGGSDSPYNRMNLTLAFFTLLTELEDLTKSDKETLQNLFKQWKLKSSFEDIYAEFSEKQKNNIFYIEILEKIYQNIYDSHEMRFFEKDVKTPAENLDHEYRFRFGKNALRVLFSNLKNRGLISLYDSKYDLTDEGLTSLKIDRYNWQSPSK